jgi:hypothetical protein
VTAASPLGGPPADHQEPGAVGVETFKDRGVIGRFQDLRAVKQQWPFDVLMKVVILYGEQDGWPAHDPLLALGGSYANQQRPSIL